MTHQSSAPGKIILSGEYAVVFGFPGIAVPAPVGVTVRYEEELGRPDLQIHWPDAHPKWIEYLEQIVDICREENEQLFGQLSVETTVPLGKGMGSSTALVIATCRALLGDDCEATARRAEDAVNPGHSGLDFATIWHNQAVEFRKSTPPRLLRLEYNLLRNTELIDTGTPNEQTHELVAWVQERAEELKKPLHTIGRCSERIIAGDNLHDVIRDHHRAQVALGVVPEEVQELIKNIEQKGDAAKVIGAGGRTGGGGMVLRVRE